MEKKELKFQDIKEREKEIMKELTINTEGCHKGSTICFHAGLPEEILVERDINGVVIKARYILDMTYVKLAGDM